MQKMVLSILIDNTPGALSRVVGLFSRRGYNIDSLTVGETENTEVPYDSCCDGRWNCIGADRKADT